MTPFEGTNTIIEFEGTSKVEEFEDITICFSGYDEILITGGNFLKDGVSGTLYCTGDGECFVTIKSSEDVYRLSEAIKSLGDWLKENGK